MQENKIENLAKEEIRKLLLVSIKHDIYNTKCLICLILKNRNNSEEEREVLIKAKRLLDNIEVEEAIKVINEI